MTEFFQDPPVLRNQYDDDHTLRTYLRHALPRDVLAEVEPDLRRFGQRVVGDLREMADDCDANEPRLVQFDPWGRRIDEIITARGWRQLDAVSAEEGLLAIGYERKHGPLSRVYQFAKLYLFNPSSGGYSCPLAMSDGAARLIEVHGDEALRRGALARLTTRDPHKFWTSGQWMTERSGGSDVGGTETVARLEQGGYRLYGTKWFTSATTAQMAMTFARIQQADGTSVRGSRGLSLFYLETRDAQGRLNHITIHRLKDKLGTRSLPTAELSLEGTEAKLVGQPGSGVRNMSTLFNITRIYNAIGAAAGMRRGLALARDYATRRVAFGRKLADQPLHVQTLADLQVEFEAAFHLTFHVVGLLGKEECGQASTDESAILRLLTPLVKLYTAKQCVAAASEILECFGGAGYVENTGLPRLLRDAQVLPIWEGTTNVLSLDALRAIEKDDALPPLMSDIEERLASITHAELDASVQATREALRRLRQYAAQTVGEGPEAWQTGARGFAYSLARVSIAALLLEHAQWAAADADDGYAVALARRWCGRELAPLIAVDAAERAASRALALAQPLSVNHALARQAT